MKTEENQNQTQKPPEEERKVAFYYVDETFGKIKIFESIDTTGWWMNKEKVVKLFEAVKLDAKPREIRFVAGISREQYDYFIKVHPHLYTIFDDFRAMPSFKIRRSLIRGAIQDPKLGLKYLERKEADEFKEKKEVDFGDKPILIDDIMN